MIAQTPPLDVITLELIKNALDAAAVEMQATLERTSYSQIIREIGDASSSLFDRHGRLVAQATALPIQLAGSSVAIKEVLKAHPAATMRPGDIFILNNPFYGGSHPPDLILTMPYFIDGEIGGFGCNYAHHHDVGGMSPGSIPPLSTEIYQEGILIPPLRLMEQGVLNGTLIAMLQDNVEDYLQTTSGSGLEGPPWLRTLEEELNRIQRVDDRQSLADAEGEVSLPECSLNLREMRQQLRQWREPLAPRKKK